MKRSILILLIFSLALAAASCAAGTGGSGVGATAPSPGETSSDAQTGSEGKPWALPERFADIALPPNLKYSDSLEAAVSGMDALPEKDFGGKAFRIFTTEPGLTTPVEDANRVNQARWYRNRLVETQYNIRIQSVTASADQLYMTVEKSVNTGDSSFELLCLPTSVQLPLIEGGLLMSLAKAPFMNTGAPYYNPSMREASSTGQGSYLFASDLTTDFDQCGALIYNKRLAQMLGIDPYAEYSADTWTFDKLLEFIKAAAPDLASGEAERWGITLDTASDDTLAAFARGGGVTYFEPGASGKPFYAPSSNISELAADIKALYADPSKYALFKGKDADARSAAFAAGTVLFMATDLAGAKKFSNMKDEFVVIPYPAAGGADKKYTTYPGGAFLSGSIPANHNDTEFCGMIAEALNTASGDFIRREYLTDLTYYYLRNYESAAAVSDMLKRIGYGFEQIASPTPEIYGGTTGMLRSAALNGGKLDALITKNAKTVQNYMDKNIK